MPLDREAPKSAQRLGDRLGRQAIVSQLFQADVGHLEVEQMRRVQRTPVQQSARFVASLLFE